MVSIVNPIERMLYSLLSPVQQMMQGKHVRNITAEGLNRMIQSGKELQLIDTRTPQEYEQFRLEGAISVPFAEVQSYIESGKLSKDKPVVFICCSGMRGYFAGMLALTYGYNEVYNLIDGLVGGWMKAGLPLIS
jgi:rhodanese-related sulfurtransferase